MASWLLHSSSAPNIPTRLANETGVAKFNWQLSILNSLDLLSMTLWHWHSHCLPCPQNLWGKKKNLSSLFPGFPRSQWFSAYKIWVAPSHFFHEPNFFCSFWNLSSCLEFHPQDSKTLNQAVTSFGFFSPSEKVQRINIFYFVGYTVPVPTMQSCSSLVP